METSDTSHVQDALTRQAAQPANPEQHATKSPLDFLGLPTKIRNSIYSSLLEQDGSAIFQTRSPGDTIIYCKRDRRARKPKPWEYRCKPLDLYVDIFQTCRIISLEAAPILYGTNTFAFLNEQEMATFLHDIGNNVKHLRCIGLKRIGSRQKFVGVLSQLEKATGLVQFYFAEGAILRYRALEMADDLSHLAQVLWATNKGKMGVTIESVVDILDFADHRYLPRVNDSRDLGFFGQRYSLDWRPQWEARPNVVRDFFTDEWVMEPVSRRYFRQVLSYSGHGIVVEPGDEEWVEYEDEPDDFEIVHGTVDVDQNQDEDDGFGTDRSIAKADPSNSNLKYAQPSKWNVRVREALLGDFLD